MIPEAVVAICTPVYDKPALQFTHSLRYLWKAHGGADAMIKGATHFFDTHAMLVAEARNAMTDGALEAAPRVTHVLFVDDDMVFPPDSLVRLLKHDKPVVGGLCFNRRTPYQPLVLREFPPEQALDDDGDVRMGYVYHYPPDALFRVDAIGAGFVLVKREVFEKIGAEWWTQLPGISEDFSFSARAREAGYELFVDTGLKVGHVGEVVVDEAFAAKNRPFELNAFRSWIPHEAGVDGKPVASVVIPTFNQNPRYLRAAILSAAYQTIPVEVIVVDDGSNPPVSTEGWPANVRVINCGENRGIATALNLGITGMTTEWFCWLSSDDMFDPRKVETQLRACLNGDHKASFHRYQAIVQGEAFARYSQMPTWTNMRQQQEHLAQGCAINGSTVMLHRSVFDKVGLFNPEFKYGQDWEFWCRVAREFYWYGLPDILGSRRTSGNLTSKIEESPELKAVRDAEDARIRAMYTADYSI